MLVCAVLTAAHCVLVDIEDMISRQRTNVIVAANKLDNRGKDNIEVGLEVPAGEPAGTIRRHAAAFWVRALPT